MSTPIRIDPIPVNRYRVVTSYPDGTADVERDLSYRQAQHMARDIREEYTYSNGGARCLRLTPFCWMLGVNLPGPRAFVRITREVRCSTVGCKATATSEITYTTRQDRGNPSTDPVCEDCGESYMRRPSLLAAIRPIL